MDEHKNSMGDIATMIWNIGFLFALGSGALHITEMLEKASELSGFKMFLYLVINAIYDYLFWAVELGHHMTELLTK